MRGESVVRRDRPVAYDARTWIGRKLIALADRLRGTAHKLDPNVPPSPVVPGWERPIGNDEASLASDDFKPKR